MTDVAMYEVRYEAILWYPMSNDSALGSGSGIDAAKDG